MLPLYFNIVLVSIIIKEMERHMFNSEKTLIWEIVLVHTVGSFKITTVTSYIYVVSGKMLGQTLVTKQSGPEGKIVSKV